MTAVSGSKLNPVGSAALGLLGGGLVLRGVEAVGASPGCLVGLVVALVGGLGLGRGVARGLPRQGRAPFPWGPVRWGLAGLALLGAAWFPPLAGALGAASRRLGLLPVQGQILVPVAAALLVGAFSIAVLPWTARPTPMTRLAGAAGVAGAVLLPGPAVWGLAGLLAAVHFGAERWGRESPPAASAPSPALLSFPMAARRMGGGLFPATCAAGAGLGAATVWSALRAWLDPSPLGFGVSVAAVAAAWWVGSALQGGERRLSRGWPVLLLTGALLLAAHLPARLPSVATSFLEGLVAAEDPRPWLWVLLAAATALPALLAGLACGQRPAAEGGERVVRALAMALAAWLSVRLGDRAPLAITVLVGLGGIVLFVLAPAPRARGAGLATLAAAAGAAFLLPGSSNPELSVGWGPRVGSPRRAVAAQEAMERSTWTWTGRGGRGTAGVRELEGETVLDLEGLPRTPGGRDASAARMGALLGALLSEGAGRRFGVVGDPFGIVVETLLAFEPHAVTVAVPQPRPIRRLHREHPELLGPLLAPQVRLRAVSGSWMLRCSGELDALVHVVDDFWWSGAGDRPTRAVLAAAREHLASTGVYVAVVDTEWAGRDGLARLVSDLEDLFPRVTGWLPPHGADQVLVVGHRSFEAPRAGSLGERLGNHDDLLGELDMEGPLGVLARAAFTGSALMEVLGDGPGPALRWDARGWGLPAGLARDPGVVLGDLAPAVVEPGELYRFAPGSTLEEALAVRAAANRDFLELLDRADAADLEALLKEARNLARVEGGERALDEVIAPHLGRARELVAEASEEGPLSPEWERAAREINVARLLHPESLEAILLMARVLEGQGNVGPAEEQYEAVLEREPRRLEALFGVARIAEVRGNRVRAEEVLRRAVRHHPRSWRAHQNLGVLLLQAGRLDEAEQVLEQAVARSEEQEAAPLAALTEVHLASGDATAALVTAQRAVRLAPTPYHRFLRGRAWWDLDEIDRAGRDFREAVLRDPEFYLARGALGQVFAAKGEYERAAEAFRAVLAQDPGNVAARVNLERVEAILDRTRPETSSGVSSPAEGAPPGSMETAPVDPAPRDQ